MQPINFIVTGILMFLFALGLSSPEPYGRSTWAPLLIGAYAVGLVGAGIFVGDPIPETPRELRGNAKPNVRGALHLAFSLVVSIALAAACFVLGARFMASVATAWALYSIVSGAVVVIGFSLTGMREPAPVAGLVQRLTITVGWGWLSVLAIYLLAAGGVI